MTSALDPRLDDLVALVRRAGRAALDRLDDLDVQRKDDGSKVTTADLAAHDVLVEGLAALAPGEAVLSEEGSKVAVAPGAPVWWVDPVDGTHAMIEGLAHWGPAVTFVADGRIQLGVFHEPRLDRTWVAVEGGGAWCDGRRLQPAEPGPTSTDRPVYLPSGAHHLPPLPWHGKLRGLGSSAAHLAQVAGGGGAAAIVPAWNPWDVGVGILLVREAGRRVVDLDGQDLDPVARPGVPFLAAATTVLPDLQRAVRAALDARGGA